MQNISFNSNSDDQIHPAMSQIDEIVQRPIVSVELASDQDEIIYQGIFGKRHVELKM